jgi:hypothetical protein
MTKAVAKLFDDDHDSACADDPGSPGNQGHDHHRPATFDQIDATAYLYAAGQPDGTFLEDLVWQVNGLENGGVHVNLPGLGSRFGLYFIAEATGANTATEPHFDTLNVKLMVDPGDDDGTPLAAMNGLSFSNGTHGDYALAIGSLVSASLSFNPADQLRHANFVEQFTLTKAGKEAFGASFGNGEMLRELLTTLPAAFQLINHPDGSSNTLVNGGIAAIQLATPGPMSLALDNLGHHGGQ